MLLSFVQPLKRRHNASPTLPVLRRPLRRGGRVLPQGAWRRGDDAYALQGKPGSQHVLARHPGQGHAYELSHRRYNFVGVRRAVHGTAELPGLLAIAAEAERLFASLADGGQVRMPLAKTFFSSRFGLVADRFGVPWMILVAP